MLEEYNEEMDSVKELLQHLDRLNAPIPPVGVMPQEIYPDVEAQLRHEYQMQHEGVAELEQTLASTELDLITENYLQTYLDDEVEHEAWLKQQVELLDQIGLQNYLTAQL